MTSTMHETEEALRTPEPIRARKHYGAVVSLIYICFGIMGVSAFSSWFAADRVKEVNGPMAGVIMITISLIGAAFARYLMHIVSDTYKLAYYQGMRNGSLVAAAVSFVVTITTWVYRDQSGGQSLNGVEAMMFLGALMAFCLFGEIVATKNLGGFRRKSRP